MHRVKRKDRKQKKYRGKSVDSKGGSDVRSTDKSDGLSNDSSVSEVASKGKGKRKGKGKGKGKRKRKGKGKGKGKGKSKWRQRREHRRRRKQRKEAARANGSDVEPSSNGRSKHSAKWRQRRRERRRRRRQRKQAARENSSYGGAMPHYPSFNSTASSSNITTPTSTATSDDFDDSSDANRFRQRFLLQPHDASGTGEFRFLFCTRVVEHENTDRTSSRLAERRRIASAPFKYFGLVSCCPDFISSSNVYCKLGWLFRIYIVMEGDVGDRFQINSIDLVPTYPFFALPRCSSQCHSRSHPALRIMVKLRQMIRQIRPLLLLLLLLLTRSGNDCILYPIHALTLSIRVNYSNIARHSCENPFPLHDDRRRRPTTMMNAQR